MQAREQSHKAKKIIKQLKRKTILVELSKSSGDNSCFVAK